MYEQWYVLLFVRNKQNPPLKYEQEYWPKYMKICLYKLYYTYKPLYIYMQEYRKKSYKLKGKTLVPSTTCAVRQSWLLMVVDTTCVGVGEKQLNIQSISASQKNRVHTQCPKWMELTFMWFTLIMIHISYQKLIFKHHKKHFYQTP